MPSASISEPNQRAYFADDGAWGREERSGRVGFRVRAGQRAEIFLRALEPVRRITIRATGGPAGDDLVVSLKGRRLSLSLDPGQSGEGSLEPGTPFVYKDSFVNPLKLRSSRGGREDDGREVGAFVEIVVEPAPRP